MNSKGEVDHQERTAWQAPCEVLPSEHSGALVCCVWVALQLLFGEHPVWVGGSQPCSTLAFVLA